MMKHQAPTAVTNLLTLAFVAVGTEYALPNFPAWETGILAFVTVISAISATWVVSRWQSIFPGIRPVGFVLVVGFYFFTGIVFFWGTFHFWLNPFSFYGYYLLTWGTLFLIALIMAGLYSFYNGIVSITRYRERTSEGSLDPRTV